MSQITQSGSITLQQAMVEQVELWRQLGYIQQVCSPLKDLEKQVLQNCFCTDILLLNLYFKNTGIPEVFSCTYQLIFFLLYLLFQNKNKPHNIWLTGYLGSYF